MKIVVKSTKTISFDENFEDDDSSDHEHHEEEDEDQNQIEHTVSGPENGNGTTYPSSERVNEPKYNYTL